MGYSSEREGITSPSPSPPSPSPLPLRPTSTQTSTTPSLLTSVDLAYLDHLELLLIRRFTTLAKRKEKDETEGEARVVSQSDEYSKNDMKTRGTSLPSMVESVLWALKCTVCMLCMNAVLAAVYAD